APFLLTSPSAAARATTGAAATRVETSLGALSLTGLALVPEGLYRPFGYLAALEAPGDFAGTRIRSPRATAGILRALGAHPVESDAGEGETAVASGFQVAPEDAVTAANVVLSAKIDLLVASSRAFAGLSRRERAILRRAAGEARAQTLASTNEVA